MPWPDSTPTLIPLVRWFDDHGRPLPWRARDLSVVHPDPYAVLVSELMLQQTQVATVLPYFARWMARFPDVATLAEAPIQEVYKHWEGLGYYRRAGFLHAAATHLASAGWPDTLAGLRFLPGVGPYTAAALASIAFQQPEPALDGNAYRVLARLLGLETDPRTQAGPLGDWLRPALSAHRPARLTQAIMELGALVCGVRPQCASCPLASACCALAMEATVRIPVMVARPKPTNVPWRMLALRSPAGWLVVPPAPTGLLSGLWRWPQTDELGAWISSLSQACVLRATRPLGDWVQVYTHRRERVSCIALETHTSPMAPAGMAWIEMDALATMPMGRRDDKLRAALQHGAEGLALDIPKVLDDLTQPPSISSAL